MKEFLRETDQFFREYLPDVTRKTFYWLTLTYLITFPLALFAPAIFDRLFVLTPSQAVLQGHVWQFGTFLLAHANTIHLLSNVLALVFLGPLIENHMDDGRRFWWFLVLSGFAGGILHTAAALALGAGDIGLVGFSGAIFALIVAALLWFPRITVYVFFILPVPLRVLCAFAGVLYGLVVLHDISKLGILGGSVSHLAHLVGLAMGWLLVRYPAILDRLESVQIPFLQRGRPRMVRLGMGHPGRHSDPDDRYNDPHWRLDQ